MNKQTSTRTAKLNTGRFATAFPKNGKLQFVINSDKFFDKQEASLFLSDRVANGEAFPQEVVVEVWVSLQWFGEHSAGTESFPAYLFPQEII